MVKAFVLLALLGTAFAQLLITNPTVGKTKEEVAEAEREKDPPRRVDAAGLPLCGEKFPMIKSVALESLNLCSKTCETEFYFKDYFEFQKCHSCCGERQQAYMFSRRANSCPVVEGKECAGKGECAGNACRCNPMWGGLDCTEKREFTYCHAVGDPHWKSFDGLYFNMYTGGEFLQYYDPTEETNEALVNNNAIYYNVAVNRGVALRRLEDIVQVVWPTGRLLLNCADVTDKVTSAPNGKFVTPSGLILAKNGVETTVTSPSGLELKTHTWDWGQNWFLRIYSSKNGQTLGLCGNNDGQLANDDGWPARAERDQPIPKIVEANRIPADESFFKCHAKAYQSKFTGALTMIDFDAPEIKTFIEAASKLEPVDIRPELKKVLSPEQVTSITRIYQRCVGQRRADAEKACWKLVAEGAGSELTDCIEDQCETSNAVFVKGAEDAAAEEKVVLKDFAKAELHMEVKEFEAETADKEKTA